MSAPDDILADTPDNRVSRQIALNEIGPQGQARIADTRFLIIGAGGLGSPVALYLACAGAGQITIVDGDEVSLSNLSRQVVHRTDAVGINKAKSAAQTIAEHTPHCRVNAVEHFAAGEELDRLINQSDIVCDCSDNLATRINVGRAVHKAGKVLVFGSVVRFTGQIAVFDHRDPNAPCFECLFENDDAANDVKAADVGVFSTAVGLMGMLQANEALKIAAGLKSTLAGRLLMVDALNMHFDTIGFAKRDDCPQCRENA